MAPYPPAEIPMIARPLRPRIVRKLASTAATSSCVIAVYQRSPATALLAPDADLRRIEQIQAATLRRLKGHFQLDNLLLFNRKFFPSWQPRFLVYERRRDLVRVGVAALAAEAYLPFQ